MLHWVVLEEAGLLVLALADRGEWSVGALVLALADQGEVGAGSVCYPRQP